MRIWGNENVYIGGKKKKKCRAYFCCRYVQLFMPLPRNWNIILEKFYPKIIPYTFRSAYRFEGVQNTFSAYTCIYISSVFASIKVNDVYILWFMYSVRLRASKWIDTMKRKNPTRTTFSGKKKIIGSYFFFTFIVRCVNALHAANAIDDEHAYFSTYQWLNISFFFLRFLN